MSNIAHHKTLLISEMTLKDNSILTQNVDMSMVTPSIQYVQDVHLQAILGTKLYRDIQKQVYDGAVSTEYKLLLDDYIEYILIYGVLSDAPTNLLYKMMNLTVASTSDTEIQPVSMSQMNFLRHTNKNKMQFYLQRLDDFLCHNQQDYPKFTANVNEDLRPSREAYTSQIAMPGSPFGKKYDPRTGKKNPAQVRYRDVTFKIR